MPKLNMGPIFESDIDLGEKVNITRESVFRLRTGALKSKRTYLLYSAAALMIDSDRQMLKHAGVSSEVIFEIAKVFQEWEKSSEEIPKETALIQQYILNARPDLSGQFATLNEHTTERLIFISLWEYYNSREDA